MQYTQSQIKAVRKLQQLHKVPGNLTDEACIEYLDWHMRTCTAKARGITSISEAKLAGLTEGMTIHEMQFRKLSDLVS